MTILTSFWADITVCALGAKTRALRDKLVRRQREAAGPVPVRN